MMEATVSSLNNSSGKVRRYDLDIGAEGMILNGQDMDWDLQPTGPTTFHILRKGQSYWAEIVTVDHEGKSLLVRINSNRYHVKLKSRLDLLLQKMGMHQESGLKINNLKAPMPGLILQVMVIPGEKVKKGDSLLILEAMKMENVIKAPADAEIKNVKVSQGEGVEKNQVLIEF